MGILKSLGNEKKFLLLALVLLVVCVLIVFAMNKGLYNPTQGLLTEKGAYDSPNSVLEDGVDYTVVVTTIYGEIYIDLYEDLAPKNVNSFLFLIGERYYEGLTFHKVIPGFVIQAGDTKGDGNGDPGYIVEQENLTSFEDYQVGMANASQFFIVLPNANKENLNGQYPVVGEVTKGFAVIESITKVELGDNYKPINDVVIENIQIHE
ncbi:MAG: peptidyl-prolyl isomerase [candidate division WS6 bacterium GW2011_GWE2_33_157]|uniref:Peptidyl-prolyl cis-trans isomerase n=1 Tax=candidate division WS6 bacterium GW2011_GWB1_33_6 TaxID=1619088 RepID=A0A0G0ASR1_9BACT|nr:MAG: peptidyl-prolyl isomerase [candidate division WS6 bacterium GW2011_GWE2_33_157]KKP44041.1 MAG: peptidyl-prolyl isomerase [candidate division WS6 bacterium GW2011_GWF1_33_233]KKP53278.1 MAG: peptidyl-prolyl isomerase [candidate division WS6 bacterium GW2011_WS6_33_547]KKP54456.1 MAG: cyclophilin type peptidyl-prolyl cis-trans isomerase [candidate division WS6 bacterium GW2011_GWB1_33_6]KKP81907.1 MAG: cyclophilin type peptidyl-prolyl cis-trans isomerase [candidate division WS6 bacterium 